MTIALFLLKQCCIILGHLDRLLFKYRNNAIWFDIKLFDYCLHPSFLLYLCI